MRTHGGRRRGGSLRSWRTRARTGLLAATAVALLGACGVGPFAGTSSGSAPSALASPGPSVTSPGSEKDSPDPALLADEPDPDSAVGALAEGFPADLLPVPDGAEVLVSSVERVGESDAYQVSLNLRTTLEAADVVAVYRASLTAAGFAEAAPAGADAALAAQSTFTRSGGDELLVIGVLDRDGVRTVTIGGRLRIAS
ncbi:hypothetical protein [Pengzhenrongella sicca]|uniref:Uncharacterized protein n=1 Tax=Pengzhenrongella sicca TaxID=2819238 RepID=A0A8A4Z923_9MICO|nr:hypothetical protein [Pengzhenrongella sicca]QTE28354.1 hypothetical protein J4E96_13315 [Pengzhenrongella sicca]